MQSTLKQVALSLLAFGAISTVDASPELNIQSRIVGGSAIDISSAPATVALISNAILGQTGSYFQAQFCGGTVIDTRWVLTAAHCLVTSNGTVAASNVSVLMGSSDLESPVNQPVNVSRIITHSGYSDRNNANDIALLHLEYDALVAPVAVDNQSSALNDLAYIVGWGAINAGDEGQMQQFPTRLRGAFVRMVPGSDCGQMFDQYAGLVNNGNLCAGLANGGVDTCQGDSGGPLYRYNEADPRTLSVAGITSWGFGCGDAQTPGVYTRVAAFGGWIQTNSGITLGQTGGTLPVNDPISPPPAQQPVQLPLQSNTQAPAAATNALNLGDTSGGATVYLLPLFALALWYRQGKATATCNRRHTIVNHDTPGATVPHHRKSVGQQRSLRCYPPVLAITVLALLTLIFWGQHSKAQDNDMSATTLDEQPIGQSRDTVMAQAEPLWQQQPVCTMVRTGYGMSKRAYFLETCTFASQSTTTLCNETPTWIEYRFFEDKLVQVAFEFATVSDPAGYRHCIEQQSLGMNAAVDNHIPRTVRIDDSYRTVIADAESVQKIHLMKQAN